MTRTTFISLLILFVTLSVNAAVKPQDYGLLTAKNGIERYMALYNAHEAACRLGAEVDYSGIDSISIEIPKKAKSIQIIGSQNFRGLNLTVKNSTVKKFTLFVYKKMAKSINLPQSIISEEL